MTASRHESHYVNSYKKYNTSVHVQLTMASKKDAGYIGRFLKRADRAIDDGVKKADDILEDAVEFGSMAAGQAKKASSDLHSRARKEQANLKTEGIKKINKGIRAAKQATTTTEHDLETLEKLGKLREAGIITEREFQAKKKKILERI